MGIDTTMTFHRSTFDWEGEEELETATGSPNYRKSFYRMSKGDSRLFRSSPPKKPTSPRRLSMSHQSVITNSVDITSLPPISRDTSAANSKWSNLSQRFRNNSSNVPTPSRLKRTNSSPLKSQFDEISKKDKNALRMASPTRNVNTTDVPFQMSTSLVQQRSEAKSQAAWERSEWAEARASGKALNNILDNHREDAKLIKPIPLARQHSSDSASSDIPLVILRGTPPLSFNPNRRPRAPFPQNEPIDQYSSTDEGRKSDHHPSLESPVLTRCPSKMKLPGRKQGLSTPPKEHGLPPRPRRPTESNIFAEKRQSSSPMKATAMQSRKLSAPPRSPPPRTPIPPVPSLLSLNQAKDKVDSVVANEVEKVGLLKIALDVPSSDLRLSIAQSLKVETSPECSPRAIVFCGEKAKEPFHATVKRTEGTIGANRDAWVELLVGGIQFEASLSTFLEADQQVAASGLVACLQSRLEQEKKEEQFGQISLSVPNHSNSRRSKNTVNSYDNPSSSSSEEDESEEELQHALAFQRLSLSRMDRTLEIEGGKANETLDLNPSLRSLSHARTPTSVSMDCESINGGDEESGCDAIDQESSATPELVGTHTFIFTTSSPSLEEKQTKPIVETKKVARLQVILNRDPHPYSSILHLLKNGSLPSYFTQSCFPLYERKRALRNLSKECQWLGYVGLVQNCMETLDVLL